MNSLLQTKTWADFRQTQGWQYNEIDGVFVLNRVLFQGKQFLYAPETDFSCLQNLENFCENVKKIAEKHQAIFFRLEILDESNHDIEAKLKAVGFKKAFEEVQPECRQIVEINKPDEDILSSMKEKGRYNIKLAQKRGVTVETSTDIDAFYKLFQETARRDHFSIRPKSYFVSLLDNLKINGYAELLVARFNGEIIAAEIVTYFGDTASYLYGASSNNFRNVMAPYLLHFEAMKRGRDKGCKFYDLLQVDPEEANSQQLTADSKELTSKAVSRKPLAVSHKYAGIGRFKRQFGGRTVQLVGSWDYIYKPVWYRLFKLAEKIRRH